MDRPLVVLDLESATARGAPHLIELGAVRVVAGEVEGSFESLVCPPVPIEPEASAIHGIVDDDVRRSPSAPEVLARFRDWVGDDWLAAHDAGADTARLAFEYARHGLEPPPGPFLDSLALAVRHVPEAPDHELATLVQVLGFEDQGTQRALAHAVLCWKVIEECLERAGGLHEARLVQHLATRGAPLTLAQRAPGAPRLGPRLRPLEAARRAGCEVTLAYGADGQPPGLVRVRPCFLYERHGHGYLEGECRPSGLLKTYRLDRVRKVLAGEA